MQIFLFINEIEINEEEIGNGNKIEITRLSPRRNQAYHINHLRILLTNIISILWR